MPAFGDELKDGEIRDVIAYVRSLQQTALLARDAPGADECTVAPRTLEEFQTLAQTRDAGGAGGRLPKPAVNQPDEAARAAITATARELVACSNAGDICGGSRSIATIGCALPTLTGRPGRSR